jgi:hypothetical protein
MSTPEHYTCHILPPDLKLKGKESLEEAVNYMKSNKFKPHQIQQLQDALVWAMLYDTWDKHKYAFRSEINRVDKIRGEDFRKTFPELSLLLDSDRRPVV